MKNLFTLTVLSLLIVASINAQTRIPLKQGNSGLQLTQISKDGFSIQNSISHFDVSLEGIRSAGDFVELKLDGYGLSFNIGNPDLPVINRLIEVPLDAQVEIIVTNYNEAIYKLSDFDISKQIMPSQESASKSADISTLKFVKNEKVYATNDWFSNPLARFHDIGIMRGVRIGRLEINPFSYNPVSGELKIFDNLEIEVKFVNSDFEKTTKNKQKYYSPAFNGMFAGLLNYSSSTREDLTVNSIPMRLEIISDRFFEAALVPFVEWKKLQGFIVNVRYTDEEEVGNTTSKIKNYLQNLYINATETNPAPAYIALIGDVEYVPAFVGAHPTDLYYTTYDGSSDMISDVHIGRISAQNPEQLSRIFDKILMYEKFEMPDPSYLTRTLTIAGYDESAAPTYGNGALNFFAQYYFNAQHNILPHAMYHPCDGQSTQVVSKLSEGVGVAFYTGHGEFYEWKEPVLNTAAVNSLTNTNKYGMYIANCCLSGKYNESECIAESVLRATNKGGVAYIGASDLSYWDEDYYWSLGFGPVTLNPQIQNYGVGFFSSWFQEHNEPEGLRAMTASQMKMAGNLAVTQSNSGRTKYYWEVYNLMGDPTFMPYIGQMPAMNPNYKKFLQMDLNTLTINDLAPNCYVALSENGNLKAAGFADNNGTIILEFEPFTEPNTADLVATTTFFRPFFGKVEVILPDMPYINLQSYNLTENAVYGETVGINLELKNEALAPYSANNVSIKVESESQYVILPESPVLLGNIEAGTVYVSENDLFITIAENVPNNELIVLNLLITSEYNDKETVNEATVQFYTLAPTLEISDIYIESIYGVRESQYSVNSDNNLVIVFNNSGFMDLHNLNIAVSSASEHLSISNNATYIETIVKNNTATVKFVVKAGTPEAGTPASLVIRASSGEYLIEKFYTNRIGKSFDYYMADETITTAFANFYDSGGPNSVYHASESLKFTFLPKNNDKKLKISFSSFNVEENNDFLYVYNGTQALTSLLIATLTGSTLPKDIESTHAQGALTFQFKSNATIENAGWTAIIYEAKDYYNVSFSITDENNKPVTDATITFDGYKLAKNQNNISYVVSGKYSYSVKKEGYQTVSEIVTIENSDKELTIQLKTSSIENNHLSDFYAYPNPFSDIIYISGNSSLINKVYISNMLGQRVKEINLNGKSSFTTENLPKGVYMISFERFDGKVETLKMIKK